MEICVCFFKNWTNLFSTAGDMDIYTYTHYLKNRLSIPLKFIVLQSPTTAYLMWLAACICVLFLNAI